MNRYSTLGLLLTGVLIFGSSCAPASASHPQPIPGSTSVVNQTPAIQVILPETPISETLAGSGTESLQFFGCYKVQSRNYNITCFVKFVSKRDLTISFQSKQCGSEKAVITDSFGRIIESLSAGFIDFKDEESQVKYSLRPNIPLLLRINFKLDPSNTSVPLMDVTISYDGFCSKITYRVENIIIQ